MKRTLLAGILGGVAMFLWSSLAHDGLPLGRIGVSEIPNEQTALAALHTSIGEQHGLYLFPGFGVKPGASREQQKAAMQQYPQKLAANASGFLVYHPPGATLSFGKLLTVEFLTELVQAILVVLLLAQTRIASFGGRVGFVTTAGVLAAIATNIPYWNWYGFPSNYTVAYMSIEIIGFFVVGLVAAAVMRRDTPA